MKKQTVLLASAGLIAALSLNTQADDTGLKGSGEFGYTNNTGNTESTAVVGAIKLDYIQPVYEVKTAFEVNNKSEDDVQTQERYVADLQYNRFYSDDKSYYSFVQARFETDEFADLDLDSLYSLGMGKTFIKDDVRTFKAEAGVGYQTINYITADDTDQVVARLKGDYTYQINEQVAFSQDAIITGGAEQTKLEANTGLKVSMAEDLNLKAGFKYRTSSDVAPGIEEVDTQTTLTIIYDF
ncbi:MAG: DUF481 domain-containing protein [Pseudomonadota bacterium]|nr:DUF481 domain-containing protein [Pseudomonadota bacterium]